MSNRDIDREEFGDFFGQERRHIGDDYERQRYRGRNRDFERRRVVDYYDRGPRQFSGQGRTGDYGRAGWTGYGSEGDWEGFGDREGGFERGMSWGRGGDYGRGADWGPLRRGPYGEYEGYSGEEHYGRGQGHPNQESQWGPVRRSGRNWGDYGWSSNWPESRFREGYDWEGQRRGGYGASAGYGGYGQRRGQFSGRGPRGYQRPDERIREDINDRLTEHGDIDASDVDVQVQNGEVTLRGTVDSRYSKHLAEDIADTVSGVKDVHNELTVQIRIGEQRAA